MIEPLVYRNAYPTVPGWYWVLQRDDKDGYWSERPAFYTQEFIDAIRSDKAKTGKTLFYAGPITPPARPGVAK